MSDKYISLVNGGVTGNLAKKLGLPRPSVLRRQVTGAPLVTGRSSCSRHRRVRQGC